MNSVIILLGQRVRSGTNFVGSTLAMHPDVVTVPSDKSLGEFNLFRDRAIVDKVFNSVKRTGFGMDIKDDDLKLYMEAYGKSWIDFLVTRFSIPQDKTIFLKSYVIDNLDLWRMSFPSAKIAIIYRDGRDNVISSITASNDTRTWHGFDRNLKKRINFYSGRSFINHSKHWAKTARKVINYIEDNQEVSAFKYESLNNSKSEISKLLKYYDLRQDDSILQKCLDAPVVGSSFNLETNEAKPNWQPDNNKANYRFSNKYAKWNIFKKWIFKQIASKELVDLNYELDNKW